LEPGPRQALGELLAPRWPLLLMAAFAAAGLAAAATPPLYRRWIAAPARLLEQVRLRLSTEVQHPLAAEDAPPALRELARAVDELVAQRQQLRHDIAQQVAQASRGIEQERNRLAALMSELTQSVVVCNLDGRILLYNNRARMQFRALSDAPALAGGAELIGLGRSIYTVFDRKLVAHALESVQQRLQRGAAHPSTQFVTTTHSGQLLRAQMAPVRAVDDDVPGQAPALSGFVLMLDNITREYEQEAAQERLLHGLTEGSRGSLANLRSAVETLGDPGLDANLRERLLGVARDEAQAMSRRIDELAAQNAQGLATRWPLEEMRGEDLVQAAQRRIEAHTGLRVGADETDGALWLKVDSFSLLQMLTHLAQRLRDEFDVGTVRLRLAPGQARRAQLDLVWSGPAVSSATVASWEIDPMASGGAGSSLTVRDVVQRHGGEFWFERERVRHEAFFRILLPLAPAAQEAQEALEAAIVHGHSRPEYYDFDLFAHGEGGSALDERRLVELAYTVFDTETTGLDPTGGDEIIQIGAARLLNGKLLSGECFEQLVNPGRPIPRATIPIHGITPEMVAGQPRIAEVLRAFHAYAQDTVLVAHNAAFDMRFLQLKEDASGVRFEQPVLDTLLLSAVVHPQQASHRLEDIAERFGVPVIGRHTALGDALVTAEIFLKLVPLLAARGIHTLRQAREAAQKTYFARLKY
ncbi:exonuclease domain-containing protein, partial [uncultured Azohydromonas sp.]|uniref:3'-5' exonuclease n=1 Tax=uncultured Azohydromonas sp. TaxID=487342 RepID=UPI00261318F4